MVISIRNGNASAESDWFWTQIWLDMIQTIEHLLPDMDIALNAMDEPRLVVPWEDINAYMKKEKQSRILNPAKSIVNEFQKLPPPVKHEDKSIHTVDKDWEDTSRTNHSLSPQGRHGEYSYMLTVCRPVLVNRSPRLSSRQPCPQTARP